MQRFGLITQSSRLLSKSNKFKYTEKISQMGTKFEIKSATMAASNLTKEKVHRNEQLLFFPRI